jgi:hypothetical protein
VIIMLKAVVIKEVISTTLELQSARVRNFPRRLFVKIITKSVIGSRITTGGNNTFPTPDQVRTEKTGWVWLAEFNFSFGGETFAGNVPALTDRTERKQSASVFELSFLMETPGEFNQCPLRARASGDTGLFSSLIGTVSAFKGAVGRIAEQHSVQRPGHVE